MISGDFNVIGESAEAQAIRIKRSSKQVLCSVQNRVQSDNGKSVRNNKVHFHALKLVEIRKKHKMRTLIGEDELRKHGSSTSRDPVRADISPFFVASDCSVIVSVRLVDLE